MLTAHDLECVRGQQTLFSGLNLTVDSGEVLHVEGPNGCGKTSLLRILCGITQPERGRVLWHDEDIRTCRSEYYEKLVYIGHRDGIKLELSPRENLRILAAMNCPVHDADIDEALARTGLSKVDDIPCANLSAGQRRRVAISRLFIGLASIWILDEPLTAIDRDGTSIIESLFTRHVRGGGLILLTGTQHIEIEGRTIRSLQLKG